MANQDPGTVARALLTAWTTGDFEQTRALLHSDAEFIGPMGASRGSDAYVSGVRGFAELVDRAEVQSVVADGEDVVVLYDLVMKEGATLPTAGYYRIQDGKVVSVHAYADPRPIAKA